MKSIKEILELMLKNQKLFWDGMCQWVNMMNKSGIINDKEYRIIYKYLIDNKPSQDYNRRYPLTKYYYWFPPSYLKPRIDWINKHIQLQPKSISDLLQIVLDNKDWFSNCLCKLYQTILNEDLISLEEFARLKYYTEKNRPSKWSSIQAYKNRNKSFYWDFGKVKPRIRWLKKHIKITSKRNFCLI